MTDPPEKVKICQNDRSIPKLLLFYVQQPFGLMFTFFFFHKLAPSHRKERFREAPPLEEKLWEPLLARKWEIRNEPSLVSKKNKATWVSTQK